MSNELSRIPAYLGLRAGDWVVVRSKEEILSTLDANGRLEELPFQPEMFAFCGRRMRVAKVAHKTCDNIKKTGGRRMENAVHLEGGRCDGSAHGGCQADCVFFWKESWLRRENAPVVARRADSAAPKPTCCAVRARPEARRATIQAGCVRRPSCMTRQRCCIGGTCASTCVTSRAAITRHGK